MNKLMRIEITVPRLGWSMEEGNFIAWLKKNGEQVHAGEPLFTLEGDKALQEVEATDDGVLEIPNDAPQPGATVKVGALLGYLLQASGREAASTQPASAPDRKESASPLPTPTVPVPQDRPVTIPAPLAATRRAITPRALAAATRLGIDWNTLYGTGRGGRIRERDVLAATGEGRGESL